jgi:hypothetical protein
LSPFSSLACLSYRDHNYNNRGQAATGSDQPELEDLNPVSLW